MYIEPDENGIKTVTGNNWRLVYNGTNVMLLEQHDFDASTGGTTEIFVADTKEECEAEVARLNLIMPVKPENN
jgi:hypothetical protein